MLLLLAATLLATPPPPPTHTVHHTPALIQLTSASPDLTPPKVASGPPDLTPPPTSPAATRPLLLLAGGGGDVDAAWHAFLAAAAHGDIVILRASGSDGYNRYLRDELHHAAAITSIVFHDRAAAHDPAVLAHLARASGIFLAGGDQSRYDRTWRDTPVAAAITAHHHAGKPLGGTSAGLAVLGEWIFTADFDPATTGGELTSAAALADPHDPRITLAPRLFDLPVLRGILTDTHFSERDRLGRLRVFLQRLAADGHPLTGLGVDEKTAVLLEPDGTAIVHTTSPTGAAHLVTPTTVQSHRTPFRLPPPAR